jgi:hydrogenase nickel incorporation protein HypA/HybF
MHELAITESLVACVLDNLERGRVIRLVIEVGKLSGVVPDALRFCFDICAQGTLLEGAELEIHEPSGRTQCRDCGVGAESVDGLPLCGCGSANVDIVAGRELNIKQLEVAENV